MPEAFEEADLRRGLSQEGTILGALVVERERRAKYVVYVRASWTSGRGYRIIETWRGQQGIRDFKSIDSCFSFIRRCGYEGRVTVYPAGHPDLSQIAGVWREDLSRDPSPDDDSHGADEGANRSRTGGVRAGGKALRA